MKIKAPAKLNLSLNVFPQKRSDGFYPVNFLNCQLALADEIEIAASKKIELVCSQLQLKKEDNLVYQAVQLLPKKRGAKILLKKKIPVKAGLGGGSSDAATVLLALNKLWQLGLNKRALLKIAQEIGLDVCYCLTGGLCLVDGVGEKIEKLNLKMPKTFLVIVVPKEQKPSTAWAYQNLDLKKIGKNKEKLGRLIQAIKARDIKKIAQNLHNDFEYSIPQVYPVVNLIKKEILKTGTPRAMLCGSGLSVFGIFENKKLARKGHDELKRKFEKVFLTETR